MTYQDQDQKQEIKLSDLIAPCYYELHNDIQDGLHTFYDLAGGRHSGKSSIAAIEIVLGIMEDPNANGIVYRKVGNTLRESVVEQIEWAIDMLGVSELWHTTRSTLQTIYLPTGQKITYKGLDKAKKSKSIKVSKGYYKYLWFEELDEFAGINEIRNVQQSVMRGGQHFVVFKTFNPPISKTNWANEYFSEPQPRTFRLKTTYLDMPKEWLNDEFIIAAEHLKATNERAYNHEYLGMAVGLGTNVFELLDIRSIEDEEIKKLDYIFQGQDWGWYPDPKAFVRCAYIPNKQQIIILDELGGCKIKNETMAETIKEKQYDDYDIFCGVDEQESIIDYKDAGLPAKPAVMHNGRRGGSRKYMFEWLQCRTIVVDPARTPNIYRELINYEHEVDGNGNVIADYPDGNDHWIDALRYSTSPLSMRRGESA